MQPAGLVTLTMRELDRLKVIQAVADTGLKPGRAAERLGLTMYNERFAKPPKSGFDAHRPLRSDEDLDLLLTWRETRRVTKALTVQYDRVLYLLDDTPENRAWIHRDIEVWEYPDGRIELRAAGQLLSAQSYDRLAEVDQGAIVDHKRLSHALQVAQAFQAQRDSRRIGTAPSRTHRGLPVRANEAQPGTKKPRRFTVTDMETAILEVASKAETERRSAKARG